MPAPNKIHEIKVQDILKDRKQMARLAKQVMLTKIHLIRSGKVIRKKYAKATVKKRKRYGLQTRYVDLTGNNAYSKHPWRMLESYRIVPTSTHSASIVWSRQEARRIYGYMMKKYSDVFAAATIKNI